MPSSERKIARVFAAKRMTSQVEVIGLKLTLSVGSVASARGIARAHRYMSTATPTMVSEAARCALPPLAAAASEVGASRPPTMVPTRIAMNVPASTSALPPTSSLWRRCCGMSEYFNGPKMVASTPTGRTTPSRIDTCPRYSAPAPQHIRTTSARRVWRIRRLFSYLSASWPESAENRKNGRMNRPCDTFASTPALADAATPKVRDTTTAFRNRLSLKAPKNCVRKNGRKRRVPNSLNCDASAPGTCSGSSIRRTRDVSTTWRRFIPDAPCQSGSKKRYSRSMKQLTVIALVAFASGCTTYKLWNEAGSDQDAATVDLSYEYRKFENPMVDERAGVEMAKERCKDWG